VVVENAVEVPTRVLGRDPSVHHLFNQIAGDRVEVMAGDIEEDIGFVEAVSECNHADGRAPREVRVVPNGATVLVEVFLQPPRTHRVRPVVVYLVRRQRRNARGAE
jgi:hypothetical protein